MTSGKDAFVKVCGQNNKREPRLKRMKGCVGHTLRGLNVSTIQIPSRKKKKSSPFTQSACSSFSYQETAVISTHHFIFLATAASCGEAMQGRSYLRCGCDQVLSQYASVPPCDLLLCPWSFVYCLQTGELKH